MAEKAPMHVRRAFLQQVAPRYQQASASQKCTILDGFVCTTGYARKYARWLLNHAEEVLQTTAASRHRYGPEVQQALVLAWKTLNQICSKRLIPFLPDIIELLEQYGHVQLSEEHRHQLLSISAATADRILRAYRQPRSRGVSTTQAGPLLKQQIPIRTFAQWDETLPGFLEADLVAHCGGRLQGGCLYTLTLTDVATGWTECLPLLNRGQEEVVAALQRGCLLFPFPILGIDTDNGGEFINEAVASYCEREQITFTRGRPYEKRDQCFVEQKNGAIVRQVVGYGALSGTHACRQLAELYRALHVYVNCFQPSMKLVAKHREGRTVRRVYDAARTPLQRLLLSGLLPDARQQELSAMAKGLDPLRLFDQVTQLQQAVFQCEMDRCLAGSPMSAPTLRRFTLYGEPAQLSVSDGREQQEGPSLDDEGQKSRNAMPIDDWRHTSKDPFAEQWEQILAWIQVNPSRSSGDIFRELQSLFPGCYQPVHLHTLQRGVRKIRTYLLATREANSRDVVIRGSLFSTGAACQVKTGLEGVAPSIACSVASAVAPSGDELGQASQTLHTQLPFPCPNVQRSAKTNAQRLTIEHAIHLYLQTHHKAGHCPKTLEWHQTALRQFQQYLLAECHLLYVSQITQTNIHDWIAFLRQAPTTRGFLRTASTIETYARSVRAFCAWLVHRGDLRCSPMSEEVFPRASAPPPPFVQPEAFVQLMKRCFALASNGPKAQRIAARNQAVLWTLFETGITVSELCALRVGDVDRKMGILRVRGKGGKERRMALGSVCLGSLLSYLDQSHEKGRGDRDDPLFHSENGCSLTKNSLTLVFARLRKRAGANDTSISPQILRHSFAFRYLQTGGNPHGLQLLLGYEEMAPVRQYLRWYDQLVRDRLEKKAEPT